MKLNEIKEVFEGELAAAEARLVALGLTVTPSLEYEQNDTEDGVEITSVLASIGISAPGIAEEDTLYFCLSEDPDEDGCFDDEAVRADVESFRADVDLIASRAEVTDDKAEAVRAVCREIDARIDAEYKAELDKVNSSVKSTLRIAITATVLLLAVAAVCVILKLVG